MPNTSATGGYLQPVSAPPLEGDALENFLQSIVVGVTALPATSVRPRWQVDPPNEPAREVDWAAVGVTRRRADTNAAVLHVGDLNAGDGYDRLVRTEFLHVLASFYGPNADTYAALLRDGLSIAQNREALFTAEFGLVEVEEIVAAPDLRNDKWLYRVDVPVVLTRLLVRDYAILNLEEADGTLEVEDAGDQLYTETLNVTGP